MLCVSVVRTARGGSVSAAPRNSGASEPRNRGITVFENRRPGVGGLNHLVRLPCGSPHAPASSAPRVINVQPAQERLSRAHRFFEDQDDDSDPEPDRNSKEVLRTVPADEPSARRSAKMSGSSRSSNRCSRSATSARTRRSRSLRTRSATGNASADG